MAKPAPRGHVIQHMGWGGGRPLVDIPEASARTSYDGRHRCPCRGAGGRRGADCRRGGADRQCQPLCSCGKGVVLATGGFAFNEEMRAASTALKPSRSTIPPSATRTMAQGIMLGLGAAARRSTWSSSSCPDHARATPTASGSMSWASASSTRLLSRLVSRWAPDQPGGKVHLCLDNANFIQPMDFARMTIAGTGDSWEEVEGELGMPAGTLSATMAFYNRHAREGRTRCSTNARRSSPRSIRGRSWRSSSISKTSPFQLQPLWAVCGPAPTAPAWAGPSAGSGLYAAGRCTSGLPGMGPRLFIGPQPRRLQSLAGRQGRKAAAALMVASLTRPH